MPVGEWDQRQLCPDGGCVGVIGPDGTCKACGRAAQNWGDERKRGLIDPPDESDDEDGDADLDPDDDHDLAADARDDDGEYGEDGDEDDDDDDDADGDADDGDAGREPAAPALIASSGEWSARRLCADGSCIGLVGPDGRCKVCRRTPAEAAGGAPRWTDGTSIAAAASGTAERAAADDAPAAQNPEAATRVACPDAGCSGAIGPDGRCDVCGKAAA
jgi:hypothetical protein